MTIGQKAETDPGRKATEAEAAEAWAEVLGILSVINPWNLPKAADHLRMHQPSAEAIALGFFAFGMIEDHKRRALAKKYGQAGAEFGFKGGRTSKKPPDCELAKLFDKRLADCGSHSRARADLVKQLSEEKGVASTTARSWLDGAGIHRTDSRS